MVVSLSHSRHSPTKAIVSNSLSLHAALGPGRLNKGAISRQISSTITYIHKQKSSKLSIIAVSLGLVRSSLVALAYPIRETLFQFIDLAYDPNRLATGNAN